MESSSKRLSMQPSSMSKRASGQPVPRPAPIPIPQPVALVQDGSAKTTESSGEGPSSSDSTNSALASVSAELVQAIIVGGDHSRTHSTSLSPASPKETNNLLGESSATPRSYSTPRAASSSSMSQRPNSAVAVVPTRADDHSNAANRPHSSADAWAARPPSVHSVSGEGQQQHASSSRSQSPSADSMLRTVGSVSRSRSTNFTNTPSPLNPNVLSIPRRPGSSTTSRPASMVLYRLAGTGDDFNPQMSSLSPPVTTNSRRASRFSTLSSSANSIFSDSKYPAHAREDGTMTPPPSGMFLAYEYDPSWDQDAPDDAEDELHKPDAPGTKEGIGAFNLRGACNIFVMVTLLLILLVLFAIYPIISYYDSRAQARLFTGQDGSTSTNSGGSPNSTTPPRTSSDLIDPDTPDSAKSRPGLDNNLYKLVFSDEFKKDGRTFGKDEDPFWEAVDLNDVKSQNQNWYNPSQVTTKDGRLVITMEQKSTHGLPYISGMLQSWNKFCFQGGYIEVSVSLPGASTDAGFTPQAYTMGNLARSGYQATEEGVWPYSYDACDNAVLANQGLDDGTSTVPAQRLSACTCPAERTNGEHPGPVGTGGNPSTGRGAPQIDILGAAETAIQPQVVSQSMRVAPLSTNRNGRNNGATIQSATLAQANPYIGDTTQQVISALTNVPAGSYVSSGSGFTSFGYEHTLNGGTANAGSLRWTEGTTETFRVEATALAANAAGTVSQRLITNEPMYIVFALAVTNAVDPTALTYPAKLLVEYVRVYQIDGQDSKVSCDPTDMPTSAYINKHQTAYTDSTIQTWASQFNAPVNNLNGGC